MTPSPKTLNIRRALISVTDKEGLIPLAQALQQSGCEIIATGGTASILKAANIAITPIEEVSGNPEAFQGRMKTLSFPICSGILYRRGNAQDEADRLHLNIPSIDCVVVNFYPFEAVAAKTTDMTARIEAIDIGGPTLVRAAAKNAPDVLVLTSPTQYAAVIEELASQKGVLASTVKRCASRAWDLIADYDKAIAREFGNQAQDQRRRQLLRYGENPHQHAHLDYDADSPIAWGNVLTPTELSYNNILDVAAAYSLASDLIKIAPDSTGVIIVKHNNPCGVCLVPKVQNNAQKAALLGAWDGDPVSAFGGVVVFTDPIGEEEAHWLSERFVEVIAAPGLHADSPVLEILAAHRKKLKALTIRRFGEMPAQMSIEVPGGKLTQSTDIGCDEKFKSVTLVDWPEHMEQLAQFGVAICRSLKSNAIALVRSLREMPNALQLVGTGQGQPNRIEAMKRLAVPRAEQVLQQSQGSLGDCVLVSDAFFPFRDTVDAAYAAGIRWIVQPGGSMRDAESIAACDQYGMGMAFTGVRHFRH